MTAKAKRQSIYIPEKIQAILSSYGENSTSGGIATLIERYARITADACPELTESEWCAWCDVNNGCGVWLSGGHDQAESAWANMADSGPDGIDEKWGVDHRELAEKIRLLPLAGRCAVWDVAARFWASPRLNEISTLDLLVESGAKVTPELAEPPDGTDVVAVDFIAPGGVFIDKE